MAWHRPLQKPQPMKPKYRLMIKYVEKPISNNHYNKSKNKIYEYIHECTTYATASPARYARQLAIHAGIAYPHQPLSGGGSATSAGGRMARSRSSPCATTQNKRRIPLSGQP